MNRALHLVLFVFATICGQSSILAETILDKMRDDPNLSQFVSLLERNEAAMSVLSFRALTMFVPDNKAFQSYTGNHTHILYHICTVATTLEQLGPRIVSDMEGNPPLYITRHRKDSNNIWVNNALVIRSRSDTTVTNSKGKKQIYHVIDGVLSPLTVNPSSSVELWNPDAFQFLTHSDSLDINSYRLRSFRQKVIFNKKEPVFQAVGGHTFFIPIEEGFKPHPRPDMIDKKVIDGHVIPGRVIFTASAPMEEKLPTLAFEDNLKVTVSFFTQGEGKNKKTYVKSNTVIGDSKHTTGVVMAEIVRANIPLNNGVVHLIQRPLMVVDTTVMQFLEEKEDGPLFKFYEVIMDAGGQFMDKVNGMKDVTIFAPSNEAWSDPNLNNFIRNKEKMREILNLHIVRDRLNTDKIKMNNQNSISQVATGADRKFLYFNVVSDNSGNQTVTVEGSGVNATIIQPDIVQTNGFVHIIDRVLGIPYTTVYDKLRTDPMLNATYTLGQLADFNLQLNSSTRRYTYFVPRDRAWNRFEIESPSAHKKLFMTDFAYHTRSILERHLVIADRAYSMAALKQYTNESIVLPTIRDSLKIRVREDDKRYSVLWNNKWIPVFRPDVECTNGIIHVIDHPMLEESDIHVTGGAVSVNLPQTAISMLITNTLMVLLAKLFV